jgi:hypothetical protein
MTTVLWTLALAVGLLWPARSLSVFDGIPLDGRAEAIVIGVVFPALWWLDRSILGRTWARALIAVLLALKIGGSLLGQEGLCARFSTAAPLQGSILTMPIDEPRGVLRSWDVRADWRSDTPACTAIFDRPYRTASEFPAWFVNILDQLRPGHRDLSMAVTGSMTVREAGTLLLRTGEDMHVRGRIGPADIAADSGRDVAVALGPGTHAISLDARLTGERWRFVPEWNGTSAWRNTRLTLAPPAADRTRVAFTSLTTVVVLLLLGGWSWRALANVKPGGWPLAWTALASALVIGAASTGRLERAVGPLLVGAALIPVATAKRNLQTAFVMVGVPWLAYFVARAMPLIGHISIYSWDDWLAYQIAGGRIYMHGFWLEGGTRTFDYQALYRWLSGALHLVFGDSSVGETYLDASCLLAGSLLAFALVRPIGGFRAALLASAGTLATFTLGTQWYFVGRGLSEIAAAGLAFGAAFLLLRARLGHRGFAAAAGLLAALTFYARQNHLLFALSLTALLLPLSVSMTPGAIRRGVRCVRRASAAIYAGVLALGVALFAARTWWYTGVFSLVYGTSLKNNDTGLRPSTLLSAEAWRKVAHSLGALVWMNEPPRFDLRALLVVAGALAAIAALCQVPRLREMPAAIVAAVVGASLSSFLAHTHGYPGRMTIHLVPFAVSAAAIAVLRITHPHDQQQAR